MRIILKSAAGRGGNRADERALVPVGPGRSRWSPGLARREPRDPRARVRRDPRSERRGQVDAAQRDPRPRPLDRRARSWCTGARRASRTTRSATCRSGAASTRRCASAASTSCASGSTAIATASRCRTRAAGASAQRVDELIELVGAHDYAHRPIGQCSGGEQQRLLIAQALARRPPLLLLDEPLDSLDLAESGRRRRAGLADLPRARSVTVLIVAHDVNPILTYLDRVVYLGRGGAVSGTARGRAHHRDADAACTRLRSRCCTHPTVGSSSSASPRPRATTPACTTHSHGHADARTEVGLMFAFHFMVNAFRAGTAVAVVAAVGGLVHGAARSRRSPVTRSRVVGFPGAAGAVWLGAEREPRVLRLLHRGRAADRRRSPHDRAGLQRGVGGDRHGAGVRARVRPALREPLRGLPQRRDRAAVRELSRHHRRAGGDARWSSPSCALVVLAVVVPAAAVRLGRSRRRRRSRDRRSRALSVLFLVVLGVAVAEAAQITGALLVFALLVVPAATAQVVTARPARSLALAVGFGLGIVWIGPDDRVLLAVSRRVLDLERSRSRPTERCGCRGGRADAVAGGVVSLLLVAAQPARASVDMLVAAVHAQRVPRRHRDRGGERARRLLRGAAQPGVQRRRAQPCRVHRRAGRPRDRARRARRLFGATVLVGVVIGMLGNRGRANDVVIGTVFTGILGVGVLFLSIYTTSSSAANGAANVNVLFGSIFGLGHGAGRTSRPSIGVGLVRRRRSASRGRCCSPASTRPSRRRAGCRCARSASCSSCSSASARPRPRRRSARCCSSGSSPGRPGAAHRLTDSPVGRPRRLGGDRGRVDVDRADDQLPRRIAPAELLDHGRDRRRRTCWPSPCPAVTSRARRR